MAGGKDTFGHLLQLELLFAYTTVGSQTICSLLTTVTVQMSFSCLETESINIIIIDIRAHLIQNVLLMSLR